MNNTQKDKNEGKIMQKNTYRLLTEKFGISENVLELIGRA